jgi:hypothetical protein
MKPPRLIFYASFLVAAVVAVLVHGLTMKDPMDAQVRGHLRALGAMLPMFFDQQPDFFQKTGATDRTYHDVSAAFGPRLETFAKERDLLYRFDAEHRLLDSAGHPVRVDLRGPGGTDYSVKFVAPRPGGKPGEEIVVEVHS